MVRNDRPQVSCRTTANPANGATISTSGRSVTHNLHSNPMPDFVVLTPSQYPG
jgi:hypothetical protein